MATETSSARQDSTGSAELTLAMVLCGTVGVFVVESGASSFDVVFFRCLFGALSLGLYCHVRGLYKDSGFTPPRLALAALGGVFIVFDWVFLFKSYTLTSISVGTVVFHTHPFYVVLLGAWVFRERLTTNKLGWILVAFAGLLLVTGLTPASLNGHGSYLAGIGYALLAALLYALATVIAKRLTGVRPHLIALVQTLVGIPLLLPFTDLPAAADLGPRWGWLVGLGVIHTCMMYILIYSSFQKLPTSKIAVLSFVYPAVAVIADYVVYGHHISPLQAAGVPLIAAAGLGTVLGWKLVPTHPDRTTEPTLANARR